MKHALLLLLLISTFRSYGQEEWDTWDQKYQLKDYSMLIQSELNYADKVEHNPAEVQYYCRRGGYRFVGEYLGKSRPMDTLILASMKRVLKLTGAELPFAEKMNEFLFEIDGKEVWAPIQPQLEDTFKKENKKRRKVTLYCSFFNEHSKDKKLYNTLLISAFHK